jgi:metallophosphoesterase (TIGR00282 family)
MRLLLVGDIVGKPGREIFRRAMPLLRRRHDPDLVIVNIENAAGGSGVTRDTAEEILAAGAELLTSGNHIWDKKEALAYIDEEPRLLRPINYPAAAPGRGLAILTARNAVRVAVINAMGRVHMAPLDNPFAVLDRAVAEVRRDTPVVLVDFHAEATSEKIALGWHLDGRVTAVIGTHTHVQTADEQILPGGTAYLTDVGMTGPHDSVIGVEKTAALARFLTNMPSRFETATGRPRLNAVLVTCDEHTGRATAIARLSLGMEDLAPAPGGAA